MVYMPFCTAASLLAYNELRTSCQSAAAGFSPDLMSPIVYL
jgi:hypothetical protein